MLMAASGANLRPLPAERRDYDAAEAMYSEGIREGARLGAQLLCAPLHQALYGCSRPALAFGDGDELPVEA
ncbi:MAG TPA: hypothetical protein VJ160_04620 [Anaerolineales bacterium]|nr:hypothetical protein [Anaerolineales bacterium]